jgi:ElaB/YqjD/DUF883 family membrane-anchored ribosome-binding protein
MNEKTTIAAETGQIMEDAQALLNATADIAGDKVASARKRLATALDSGRAALNEVREKAIAGARATDEAIREHPYQSIGVALGVGVLLGFLLSRRS